MRVLATMVWRRWGSGVALLDSCVRCDMKNAGRVSAFFLRQQRTASLRGSVARHPEGRPPWPGGESRSCDSTPVRRAIHGPAPGGIDPTGCRAKHRSEGESHRSRLDAIRESLGS